MADREQDLSEKIEQIRKVAKANPGVDEAALASALLQEHSKGGLPGKEVARAYVVSLLAPPFGLYYVFKYWLRSESDARKTAIVCLIMTTVSLAVLWFLGSVIFSSPQIQSIQNLNPQDVRQLTP